MERELLKMAVDIAINRGDNVENVLKEIDKIYNYLANKEREGELVGTQVEGEQGELEELRKNPEKSIGKKFVVCLECGEKYSILSQHLRKKHRMTPSEYKSKWGLKLKTALCSRIYSKKRVLLIKDKIPLLVQKMKVGKENKKMKEATN